MDRVLLTKQPRSDTPWAAFGIIVVFGLASGCTVIAIEAGPVWPVRVIASAASILLVAVGLRGLSIYFQRRAYTFSLGTETIAYGWVHKPKRQTRIAVADIAQVHWQNSKNDTPLALVLKSGAKIKLPLQAAGLSKSKLRPIFDNHFPHIESVE